MNPLTKRYLNYGSYLGTLLYLFFLVYLYVFQINPLGNIKWIGVLVQYVLLFLWVKKIRDEFYMEEFSFRSCFSVCMYIVLIYSTLFSALIYIHALLVDQGYVQMYIDQVKFSIEEMNRMGMFSSVVDKMEEHLRSIDLQQIVLGELFNKSFGGLLVSFIFSFFLKKQAYTSL